MVEDILNWESIFGKSDEFIKQYPTKWTFIENFFDEKLYDELQRH